MRVLMIGWELPPQNSGGLGVACYGLAKALTQKGVDVTFILPQKMDLDVDFMRLIYADSSGKVQKYYDAYTTIASVRKLLGSNKSMGISTDYVKGALMYAENIRKLVKNSLSEGFDLIHSHDWLTMPAAFAVQDELGIPLITHVHATEFDRTGGHFPNEVVYAIERNGVHRADMVVAVSKHTRNTLIREYGVNFSKVGVVYNGIDQMNVVRLPKALSNFREMGYKIVLFLGRITLQKGPEYYIRAAKRVLEYDQKVLFVVTGSGDMQDAMMDEAYKLGIMNNMMFTGFVRGEEKDRIFQTADVYVCPSVSEPFGITVLESIANGTPVVVSKQSGVSEVIKNILKVDFWDVDEMANKIYAAINYPALKQDLVIESKKELANLSWEDSANSCINYYQKVI